MKKLFLIALFVMFVFPALLFGYTNLAEPPAELNEFLVWLFSSFKSAQGQGLTVLIAFVMTGLVGLAKLSPLKSFFDKLGNWKFILIMSFGAIAELLINLPKEITVYSIASLLFTGATGTGALSIAFHHIVDNFKAKK